MAIKRMVPGRVPDGTITQFADGPKQVPTWERDCLAIDTSKLPGVMKPRKRMTYQEWLEKVVTPERQSAPFRKAIFTMTNKHLRGE